MSASLIVPLELEYMNWLHWVGWNSAAVMTSVNSSMLTGLMSTMSRGQPGRNSKPDHGACTQERKDSLKLWSLMLRFHKLIRRSSAEM